MRSRRRKSEPVDPNPVMDRGETPFEEKWLQCEFDLIFNKVAEMGMASIKQTYEYVFRAAYFTGKRAGKRESLGSPQGEL